MKKNYAFFFLMLFFPFLGKSIAPLAPTVTLSTEAVPAGTIAPGGAARAYLLKLISTEAFVLNSISFQLSGSLTPSDFAYANLQRNTTTSTNFATNLGNNFTMPSNGLLTFTLSSNNSIAANTAVYFFLTVGTSSSAVIGRNFKVNGANNPVTLNSTASVLTIVNNQTDIAGITTILIPTLTLSSETVPSSNVVKGSIDNTVYILKITNDLAANMREIKVKFSGTFMAGDISGISFKLRSTLNPNEFPSYQSFQNGTSIGSGNTFIFSAFGGWNINANSTNYLFISVSASLIATSGRTVEIDGLANPVLITNTISPITTINNQTDLAGTVTIVAPDISISTEASPATTISQSNNGTAYIFKLLSTTGGSFTGVNIPIEGTITASDIEAWNVFYSFSPTATSGNIFSNNYNFTGGVLTNNTLSGSSFSLGANSPIYIILRPKFAFNAVAGHTLKVNGATNPATLNGFAGTPINNQTDAAGELTISAPTLTITSLPVAAATVAPIRTLIYSFKINTNESYSLSNINLKIDGTFTAGQIQNLEIRQPGSGSFNIADFALKGPGEIANFTLVGGTSLAANTDKIFDVYANFSPTLPDNYTVKVNGISNELSLVSPTKTPTIVNNQTDIAGVKTVIAPMPTIYTSSSITDIGTQAKASYSSSEIITKVSSPLTISGNTNCQVWPTGGNLLGYVPRHYEINPPAASSGASATITLYFTQAEFDAFNADDYPIAEIPTNPNDASGKANLRIYKFSGASTDTDGLIYSSNTPTVINPIDNKIIWNALASRWEITFDITGFSGFFVGAETTTLPLNLLSFKAQNTINGNQLIWKTSLEHNFSHFEIERSENGEKFSKIASVNGTKAEQYEYLDERRVGAGMGTTKFSYYRLKMVDMDGSANYSKKVLVNNSIEGITTVVNPTRAGEIIIYTHANNPNIVLRNTLGQQIPIHLYKVSEEKYLIRISASYRGFYLLSIFNEAGKVSQHKIRIE